MQVQYNAVNQGRCGECGDTVCVSITEDRF